MTEVQSKHCSFRLQKNDRVLMLGSCFAANIGEKLLESGYDVCLNPFGTLFNPASIASSLLRLDSAEPFVEDDCVQMGAGSDLWCSFSHYTRFARATKAEFLENANARLAEAAEFWRSCDKVIITFGTAYVFRHKERGVVVSNCLKRNAAEFERYRLGVGDIVALWEPLLEGPLKGKDTLFTVSPIRHMADTAHGNRLSKATLLLATDEMLRRFPAGASYYPAYEIMLDELRDYVWYAGDEVHPSDGAVDYIWKRFSADLLAR